MTFITAEACNTATLTPARLNTLRARSSVALLYCTPALGKFGGSRRTWIDPPPERGRDPRAQPPVVVVVNVQFEVRGSEIDAFVPAQLLRMFVPGAPTSTLVAPQFEKLASA